MPASTPLGELDTTATGGSTAMTASSADDMSAGTSGGVETGTTTSGPDPSTGVTTTSGLDPDTGATVDATGPVQTNGGSTAGSSSDGASSGDGASSTGDTGEPAACEIAGGPYGDCDAVLGWAFDGAACRRFSGCGCEPDCDLFFADPADCAIACAAQGGCNEDHIKGAYLAEEPITVGDFCDHVQVCISDDESWTAVEEIFGQTPQCVDLSRLCPGGTSLCESASPDTLDAQEYQQMCAASLLAGVDPVYCVVLGP